MGPIGCPSRSLNNCDSTLRNTSEERSHLHLGGSLKLWYDMIYLSTAIGLTPCSSSTVHIYTQTIHRTTKIQTIHRTTQIQTIHRTTQIQTIYRTTQIQTIHRTTQIQTIHRTTQTQTIHRTTQIQTIHRTTQIQTIHRTTKITTSLEECGPCLIFASFTLAFALQLRKKHGKTSVRIAEEWQYCILHIRLRTKRAVNNIFLI